MKTALQLLTGILITFFTFVPVKIEEVTVVNDNILYKNKQLEETIVTKISNIEKDKNEIRKIQQELGIN